MHRFLSGIVLMIATAFTATPVVAMEYCLDRNSKLYQFVGEVSRTVARGGGPEAHGWKRVAAEIKSEVMQAAASDHFHIPACPTLTERIQRLSPKTREAIKRMSTQPQP